MSETALWYEKYRPTTLDDYVWVSGEVRSRMELWAADPSKLPHLILEGPPGTGKTTLAMIMSLAVLEDEDDLLYINTNKYSGVDAIRDTVTTFCESGGFGGIKVVFIDEADGLSLAAQEKLRGVINDYGDYVRFIFTCNHLRRITEALKSRARPIEIRALDDDKFLQRLIAIAEAESISLDDDAVGVIGQIFEATYPDLRKAISSLQDCARDGALHAPLDSANAAPEWTQGLSAALQNRQSPKVVRELVASMRKDEIEEAYRFIYENSSELFEEHQEQAGVVIVANYLKVHQTVAFPDINLAGCLNELIRLRGLEA